jgi:hypothetical protein
MVTTDIGNDATGMPTLLHGQVGEVAGGVVELPRAMVIATCGGWRRRRSAI